jgi:hypothetical protein
MAQKVRGGEMIEQRIPLRKTGPTSPDEMIHTEENGVRRKFLYWKDTGRRKEIFDAPARIGTELDGAKSPEQVPSRLPVSGTSRRSSRLQKLRRAFEDVRKAYKNMEPYK